MTEINLNNIPYARWLENALQELFNLPVRGICLAAVGENGEIYTNYHDLFMSDKLVVAGVIQQDAMLDTMYANGIISEDDKINEGE